MKTYSFIGVSRNLYNSFIYGSVAPRFEETVWIAPATDLIYDGKLASHQNIKIYGKVVEGSWPLKGEKLISRKMKARICYKRWVEGMSWEDAGAYQWMERSLTRKLEIDGCRNRSDMVKRYGELDRVYADVKENRRFRDDFSVTIHVGPGGKLHFGFGGGAHRLAIASILDVQVKARIGLVHVKGFSCLKELRQRTHIGTGVTVT